MGKRIVLKIAKTNTGTARNRVLHTLLSHGYFPRELPPPFVTVPWADLACSPERINLPPSVPLTKSPKNAFVACMCKHTLTHPTGARRKLGIPNPISQLLLCEVVADGTAELRQHWDAGQRPFLSASRPMFWPSHGRAFVPRYSLDARTRLRLRTRSAARWVVHTDVAQFYGSIYTHSIPWALHGKASAKSNKNNFGMLGNRLDLAVRNGQDMQTIGVPIGPDTSLVVAETILKSVDMAVQTASSEAVGFRFIDDFEISFLARRDAERCLSVIESALHQFELSLNPKKTRIEEVPATLNSTWVDRLREVRPTGPRVSAREVERLASVAFECAAMNPHDSVLKFALATLTGLVPKDREAAQHLQALAFNAISSSPSAVSRALGALGAVEAAGHRVSRDRLAAVLGAQLQRYVEVLRPNETAWALWGALAFDVALTVPAELGQLEDDVVALLALDGLHRGLWQVDTRIWERWCRFRKI